MKALRILVAIAFVCVAIPAAAQPTPAAPSVSARSYILIDHRTGHIITEGAADLEVEPASLTKLMTAYVVFAALADGSVGIEDLVPVSVNAWQTEGSRMFIQEGTRVPLIDLLRGMIIVSGNDASVALAEYVAGTESAFADLMNYYARELGMTGSYFVNSTGLPAQGHVSTARDMGTLIGAIIHEFPQYYSLYSEQSYTWNGITQANRNTLLRSDSSVDGGKTGFTDAAGYCLVTSAERDGMRLISVVMGTNSETARATASSTLLNYGFRWYESYRVFARGETVTTSRVWKGNEQEVSLGVPEDLWVTVERNQRNQLSTELVLPATLTAPLSAGDALGNVLVTVNGREIARSPLLAQQDVGQGGLFRRLRDTILLWLR